VVRLLDELPRLVVVRTFSKAFRLAGLRLGYLLAARGWSTTSRPCACPTTSTPSSRSPGWSRSSRSATSSSTAGGSPPNATGSPPRSPRTTPSRCSTPRRTSCSCAPACPTCSSGCSTHGVLVRDFSARPRLAGCVRVTIGTAEENDAFLAALAAVLADADDTGPRAAAITPTPSSERTAREPRRPRHPRHQGDPHRGAGRPRRRRDQHGRDRRAVLRPHARPARPPRPARPHRDRGRRPGDRRPPHGRGRRDRARSGARGGVGRSRRGRAVRRRDGADRRGPHPRRGRPVGPALPGVGLRGPDRGDRHHLRDQPRQALLRGRRRQRAHHPARPQPVGDNTHHTFESVFKAVAVALRRAVRVTGGTVPSTKGVLQ
jgi:hypothetical protein